MSAKKADAIVIGAGWAGSILAKELTEAGLSVTMLERGPDRSTADEGDYPNSIDELRGAIRHRLFQNVAKSTVTIRNTVDQTALPYRQLAAFLPGEGVGGAGLHWSGVHFRVAPDDLALRSNVVARYGEKFIPEGMNLQDYGVTYEELEPFFDKAEKVFGTSGEPYKINGQVAGNGNVFAPSRSDKFPLPPMKDVYSASLFRKAATAAGYHPYSLPAANASAQYTNPYGVQMGPCNFCGFCSGYDCYMYSKASPNVNILPALRRDPNFTLITKAHVLRVNLDSDRKKATGVTYLDLETNKEVSLDADLVIVGAFQFHNVHLMLLSGIGEPYDPVKNTGTVGRNFVYQTITTSRAWLSPQQYTNTFVGAGGAGVAIDDFNSLNFDHGPLGFVGGSPIWVNQAGVKPIAAATGGAGGHAPRWGAGFKEAMIDTYRHSLTMDAHGSNMAYRDVYLDLDPTWKDAYGQPLLRMTFTWKDNDIRMNQYVVSKIEPIMKEIGATRYSLGKMANNEVFDTRRYQTTHLGGGAIMGADPRTSAVNRYLQSWDVSNVFVIGASAFPQGMGYNPTGMVAALAYWAAYHIRTTYLKNPGPMVQA
ncbi:gluconate 2-dehydrogenase [Neoasaia chiangmaiensis NBRC 101099]|uniref:GMC family oxidoreductase n=1 Tax=Neoasaia chiangmaiensis TaxID=320497 RepID=A0A1U9KQ21_9PROT|nr:GMC family oxidoreductase [Neoasaia chiangmaiensis]AQS87898.1 GMC family oxidoreductase [Neoasaia chiangmaiensis]GBR39150.1 gluconate 2-dehydrogenase [Neoasaia chiangmaiensis NBRC 101099]GEN15545.1 gluconate dehydrogenase [Neoasaia chiangmaiensis]